MSRTYAILKSFFAIVGVVAVGILFVQHHLNRVTRDVATTHPHHRADPSRHLRDLKSFAGRESIEVTGDEMKAVLVFTDPVEQEADLTCATPLTPLREPRTQVQSEDANRMPFEDHLEKRMPSA